MGEAVSEHVRMQAGDASFVSAAVNELEDATVGEAPGLPEPEPLQSSVRVLGAQAHIPVERLHRLSADGHDTFAATLTEDSENPLLEVDVIDEGIAFVPPQVRDLAAPTAGIDKHTQQSVVAPVVELLAVGAAGE